LPTKPGLGTAKQLQARAWARV